MKNRLKETEKDGKQNEKVISYIVQKLKIKIYYVIIMSSAVINLH